MRQRPVRILAVVLLGLVATSLVAGRRRPDNRPMFHHPVGDIVVSTSTVYSAVDVFDPPQVFHVWLSLDGAPATEVTGLFTYQANLDGPDSRWEANLPIPLGHHEIWAVQVRSSDGMTFESLHHEFDTVEDGTLELGALTGTQSGTSGQVVSQDVSGSVPVGSGTAFVFGETELNGGTTPLPATYASSTDPVPTDGIDLTYFDEPPSIEPVIPLAPANPGENDEEGVRLTGLVMRAQDLLAYYHRIDTESGEPASGVGLVKLPGGIPPFERIEFPNDQPPGGGHFDDAYSLFQAGELAPVGSSVVSDGYAYLFGVRSGVGAEPDPNYVILGRVPLVQMETKSAYEYWTDVGGVADFRPSPTGIVSLWANSSAPSVAWNPFLSRWLAVSTVEDGVVQPYGITSLRSIVELRMADALSGPWSSPLVVWQRPQTEVVGPLGSAFDPVQLPDYHTARHLYFAANDGGEQAPSTNAFLYQVALEELALPPAVEVTSPPANGFVNTPQVLVEITAPGATGVTVEGLGAIPADPPDGTFTAQISLSEGANVLDVVATNANGTTEIAHSVALDTGLPAVTITAPADGSVVTVPSIQVTGTVTDASPLSSLTVAGVAQTPAASFSVSVPLSLGSNVLAVQATDAAGNLGTASVTVTLELAVVIASPTDGALIEAAMTDVSGTVNVPGATVSVNGVDAIVTGTSFSRLGVPLAQVGSNHVSASATSGGDSATQQIIVVRLDSPPPPPGPEPTPDPATVPLTVAADLDALVAFLYEDPTPVQTGTTPSAFDPKRIAVLRGQVLSRGGVGVAGVSVRVEDHPEHGVTLTRADGMFDLAVNGGGLLTVVYEHPSYLPARRKIEVPWRDYTWLPDVVLIPPDPAATTVSLPAPPNPPASVFQVVQGSVATDALGPRRSTLLIPPGTTATSAGQPKETLTVRVTEYTVGSTAEAALPLALPPGADATYLVEWAAQEAPAGVSFSQPVFWYVDNFTGYHVGTELPNASLDVAKGAWIEEPHGRVLRIVSESEGLVTIDVTGDNAADDVLALIGMTDAERAQLAALYDVNQELWRIPIGHFSCPGHFRVALAGDVIAPPFPRGQPREPGACSMCSGSILHMERQVLGEVVEVVGTPHRLHYRSDRVPGYEAAAMLEIPVSGADPLPASLVRIDLEVCVAGKRTRVSLSPTPNQTYPFTWDGTDAYGRVLQGRQRVTAKLTYRYAPVNLLDEDGMPVSAAFKGRGLQGRSTLWRGFIGRWDAFSGSGLGGWSLSAHHAYDRYSQVLHRGDGGSVRAEDVPAVIRTVAGGGGSTGCGTDVPATGRALPFPISVAAGPDGSFYVGVLQSAAGPSRVCHVDSDGKSRRFAGMSAAVDSGDGLLATSAEIASPSGLAVGPDGSFYIATKHRVRRVDPAGFISTFAGTGTDGYDGDGGPATSALLDFDSTTVGLAVGPDGGVYIADRENLVVRRVSPDGIIETVAGGAGGGFPTGDGGPALDANIGAPDGLAFDADGRLYIVSQTQDLLWRFDPDGLIHIVAGQGGNGCNKGQSCGDGRPALAAGFNSPRGVAVGPDGSLYVVDQLGQRIRRIDPDGIISTVAGVAGQSAFTGDGGPATAATMQSPKGVAVMPDGSLLIADHDSARIRRVAPALPGFAVGDIDVPSEDGSEIYEFNPRGLHLRTLDGATQAPLFLFGYSTSDLLETIEDADGNVTTILRSEGDPTAIDPPFAGTTQLSVDASGYLDSIVDPAGNAHAMVNTADGLLDELTTPAGDTFDFDYEPDGRLLVDADPEGGSQILTRSEADVSVPSLDDPMGPGRPGSELRVSRTTGLGRVSEFAVQDLKNGTLRRETVDAAGFVTAREINRAGTEATKTPDGTITTVELGSDPRLGLAAPFPSSLTIETPGGRSFERTQTRTLIDPDGDPETPDYAQTDSVSINSKPPWVTSSDIVGANRVLETTSPEARLQTAKLDDQGRVIEAGVAGIDPVRFAYDPQGRLATLAQGPLGQPTERITTFRYDPQGFLEQIEDPEGRIVDMTRDLAGRVDLQTFPFLNPTPPHDPPGGTEVIAFAYDPNGNVSAITPPGQPVHELFYTKLDQEKEYRPPVLLPAIPNPQTLFDYDLDRALDLVTRPDGKEIDPLYDTAGRLDTLALLDAQGAPEVVLDYGYDPGTGNLSSITRCDAPAGGGGCAGTLEGLALGYDGALPTTTTWSGAVAGTVAHGYDDDLRIASEQVNAEPTIVFQYDDDNLLTGAGALSLVPHPQNGLLSTTALGVVTTSQSYSPFGELELVTASVSASPVYTLDVVERDKLGRITELTETLQAGPPKTLEYEYDTAGRLDLVRENGSPVRDYTYDANGNRLSTAVGNPTPIAAYDGQDRLTSYGGTTYTYTANGELETRTEGGQTTSYSYDLLGNLTRVDLPGGTVLEYVIDGLGRRIGKKVDDVLERAWLYGDALEPVAELDGTGAVVSRFVYGSKPNVPDYMVQGTTTYRILSDHLGSVRLVVDATTGAVAQRLGYDEFGNPTFETGPADFQPFGFAGGLYDGDTGLVRFGARDYDPEVGRWTAKDPIGFEDGLNLYGYALADPVNLLDQDGLAVVINNTGRPLAVSGNVGGGRGTGKQVAATIPAGTVSRGVINRQNPAFGGSNPIQTCEGPISDVDFVEGKKIAGNQFFPVVVVNQFTNPNTGQKELVFTLDPIRTAVGVIQSLTQPSSLFK